MELRHPEIGTAISESRHAINREPSQVTQHSEAVPLSKAVEFLLEECRMVLPGLQALFGFQLIAVFNSSFTERLTTGEQRAIAITTSAMARRCSR